MKPDIKLSYYCYTTDSFWVGLFIYILHYIYIMFYITFIFLHFIDGGTENTVLYFSDK